MELTPIHQLLQRDLWRLVRTNSLGVFSKTLMMLLLRLMLRTSSIWLTVETKLTASKVSLARLPFTRLYLHPLIRKRMHLGLLLNLKPM